MNTPRSISCFYNFTYLPIIVVGIGMTLSILTAMNTSKGMEQIIHERFIAASEQTVLLVEQSLDDNIELLKRASLLFENTHQVDSKEWKLFAKHNQLDKHFNGLQGLAYAPLVMDSMRSAYERQMQSEGFTRYAIFPKSSLVESFPISYIEPYTSYNQKALGFDLFSEAIRREAIMQSIQRGDVSISSKINLVQEKVKEEQIGFVIFLPLFKLNSVMDTKKPLKEYVEGVLVVGIKAKELFAPVQSAKLGMLDFEVHDGLNPSEETKIFDSNAMLKNPTLERYVVLNVYGKKWTLYFKSNDALGMEMNQHFPLKQLLLGITLSLLFAGIIYFLLRSRKEALLLINENSKKIAHSEAKVRSIFEAMQEGIMVMDKDGIIKECNLAAQQMLGLKDEAILGQINTHILRHAIREDGTLITPNERPFAKAYLTKEAQNNVVLGIKNSEKSLLWVQVNAKPQFVENKDEVSSVIVTLSDITTLHCSKHTLERYLSIIDRHVIISNTDCYGIITEVSEAFCEISGYSKEELLGNNHNMVRHPDFPASTYKEMWQAIQKENGIWQGELKNRRKDGSAYWVHTIIEPRYNEEGHLIGYAAIRQDITDKKRVEELSITDRLTGLYNRLKLDELFAFYLSIANRHQGEFSVILLDIDKFKSVNDTYGHQVGDSVLIEMATLLRENSRFEDGIGRWGGEEFLILLPSSGLKASIALAEKLRNVIAGHSFKEVGRCTASFGIATFHKGDNETSMVARADKALYVAKESGRNRVEHE